MVSIRNCRYNSNSTTIQMDTHWQRLSVVIVLIVALIGGVESVQLDENGYFDIVIAISEKTSQGSNDEYLEYVKSGIQDLGDALWESTKHKFSIRSADIVVPRHWEYVEEDGYATTQSFQTADIRISHEYLVPQAINPMFCSYPGQFIELPSSIFDTLDTGRYGPTGKALLTLWARFRWGIHEEHGFPGDPQFPYYWRKMRLPDDPEAEVEDWKVTNCANAKIEGTYEDLDGAACAGGEGWESLYPPSSDCRFFPNILGQDATTSLMSFPFIQSLLDFCDATTHNKRAPTRQNHFCWYKSAWEIIMNSPDWRTLKENSETVRTRIEFRVLKQTPRPLLFVLTEGVNELPPEVITGVATGLKEIFNQTVNWNVPAGVGVFPGQNEMRDSFDTLYSWNFPWNDGASQMIASFESASGSRSGFKNFGAAIQDVGNHIKEKHPSGAVILILKYGSETEPLEQKFFQAFEGEILATILEQNIQIFALEGTDLQADQTSYRLEYLTGVTGGSHFKIEEDNPTENTVSVARAMAAVNEIIINGVPVSNHKVVHKESVWVQAGSTIPPPIRVNQVNVKNMRFFFHQLSSEMFPMDPPIFISHPITTPTPPEFGEHFNWGKGEMYLKSYRAEAGLDEMGQPAKWEYEVYCPLSNCFYLITAIAELDPTVPTAPEEDFSISLFTSADADDSLVDLMSESVGTLKGTAFSVYAKVEKNGHPIHSPLLEVKAHIQMFFRDEVDLDYFGSHAVIAIDLVDDGLGTPDMTGNDGIFSGNYIPQNEFPNGDIVVHQIFVSAKLPPVVTKSTNETGIKSQSSKYQLVTRCGSGWGGCWSEAVTEPFMIYADLKRRVEFKGSLDYAGEDLGAASRIIDLRVVPHPSDENRYILTWTVPLVQKLVSPLNSGKFVPTEYQIFYTENFYHITDDDKNQFLIEVLEKPSPGITPGAPETFEIPGTVEPDKKYYYVMRSWGSKQMPAVWSNVAFLHAGNPYVITTTTTSKPPTPPASTPTTTTRPTRPPQTTTVPSLTTTTASTPTTTSRTTRSTTTVTTQSTSTTPTTTTVGFEATTKSPQLWYQSTGAIVTFSVFSVVFLLLILGGLVYIKFIK